MAHSHHGQARQSQADKLKRLAPDKTHEYPQDKAVRLAGKYSGPNYTNPGNVMRRVEELEAAEPYRHAEPTYEAPLLPTEETAKFKTGKQP